jgi:hypothetical protein
MEPTGRREAPPDDRLRAIRVSMFRRLPRIFAALRPDLLPILVIPRLPRGVMDMEYLHRVAGNLIKNLVGIAAQRHHANARAFGRAA